MSEENKPASTPTQEGHRPKADDLCRRGYQPKTENGEVIRPQDLTPPKGDMAIEPPPPPKNDQKG